MTDSDYKLAWISMRTNMLFMLEANKGNKEKEIILKFVLDTMDRQEEYVAEMDRCF